MFCALRNYIMILALMGFSFSISKAQDEPILVEAESGVVGADYEIASDGDITYARITTNLINADNPGSGDRVITMEVTFPDSGYYDLYGKVKIGPQNADDDSYFYANKFGIANTINNDDWITVNNIGGLGFPNPEDVIYGNGGASNDVFKWYNFSELTGQEPGVSFHVDLDSLTQTFMVGGREDGFLIDKFAFGKADLYWTVEGLENGDPGVIVPPIDLEIPDGPPLADGKCKYLGSCYSDFQKPYFDLLWNQIIPEDAGKWGSVERVRNEMNWSTLDSAYKLAKDNGFPFQFHVLIWGNQQPAWIESLITSEQREEIEEWFDTVSTRYPDIDMLQVVNEPLHDPPAGAGNGNYIDALGGAGTTGWDWVIEAYTLARTYFPDADLMINDYNIVNSSSTTSDYLELIALLQEENLIDAIGVQAHNYALGASASTIKANLDALAATGLPVYATEFDISGPSDAIHESEYQRVFPVFWEHPGVLGVTLWGYRPGMWNSNTAYLLNPDGSERPSMEWLSDYVASTEFDEACIVEPEAIDPPLDNKQGIHVYPNPCTDGSFIVNGLENTSQMKILTITGKEIISYQNIEHSEILVNLNVSSGVYILQLTTQEGNIYKKIILE